MIENFFVEEHYNDFIKNNKSKIVKAKITVMSAMVLIIIFAIGIVYLFILEKVTLLVCIILIFCEFMVLTVPIAMETQKYYTLIRDDILHNFIKKINSNVEVGKYNKLKQDYIDMKMESKDIICFEEINSFEIENQKDISIRISTVRVYTNKYYDLHQSAILDFLGEFAVIEFDEEKFNKSYLKMCSKKNLAYIEHVRESSNDTIEKLDESNDLKVELSQNQLIDDNFEILIKDRYEIDDSLPEEFLNYIAEFCEKYEWNIDLVVNKNKIYVRFPRKASIEIDVFSDKKDKRRFYEIYAINEFITNTIKIIN